MGIVVPSRGLRQGDPLSPYIFILCAEGLSAILRRYESQSLIRGIKVCRQAPTVNHLLFAYDSYLFCKANEAEALKKVELLQVFEEALGRHVNFTKSSVVFSININIENKESCVKFFKLLRLMIQFLIWVFRIWLVEINLEFLVS